MELLILNREFETVAVCDVYESFIWTDRYYDCGDFEIYMPTDLEFIELMQQDFYLWFSESEHMMIIEEIEIETDAEMGNHTTIRGRSLESILTRRIVMAQTNLTGNLQTAIQTLLNDAIINPSDIGRKIDNFLFEATTDTTITSLTVEAQFTGEILFDAIKSICEEKKIGFKVTLNDQNQFVFKLYRGIDRSYDQDALPYVVFAKNFENIINSNYLESKKTLKTITLVAGEGEGADRRTLVVGDTTITGLDRREMFIDARDISSITDGGGTMPADQYNALLEQRGKEKLAENKITKTFDGETDASQMFTYGDDFYIGDIVEVENDYGHLEHSRITEYIYSYETGGISRYPTFEIEEEET